MSRESRTGRYEVAFPDCRFAARRLRVDGRRKREPRRHRRDYVKLQLEIGEKEEGLSMPITGAEWQAAAKLRRAPCPSSRPARRPPDRLAATALAASEPLDLRRRDFLAAQLKAAATRLRMLRGEKLSFADEAEGLSRSGRAQAAFGLRPDPRPDCGAGAGKRAALAAGDDFQDRFNIEGADRAGAARRDRRMPQTHRGAYRAARRRALHAGVRPGKSWGGYNWYKGGANSRSGQYDLPIRISRAVDLGCHEGYPAITCSTCFRAEIDAGARRGRI